eukprot:7387682-Prymnesium_polylepis.1
MGRDPRKGQGEIPGVEQSAPKLCVAPVIPGQTRKASPPNRAPTYISFLFSLDGTAVCERRATMEHSPLTPPPGCEGRPPVTSHRDCTGISLPRTGCTVSVKRHLYLRTTKGSTTCGSRHRTRNSDNRTLSQQTAHFPPPY